jgi:two-component system CheB/CheR fusion protein
MGAVICIDDFGIHQSAVAQLQQCGASEMKLSRQIIEQPDDASEQLLRAYIDVANVLGMTVVADQVETEEQMDYLVSVGCELAQGFVFSAPVTFDNMLEKLDR